MHARRHRLRTVARSAVDRVRPCNIFSGELQTFPRTMMRTCWFASSTAAIYVCAALALDRKVARLL